MKFKPKTVQAWKVLRQKDDGTLIGAWFCNDVTYITPTFQGDTLLAKAIQLTDEYPRENWIRHN